MTDMSERKERCDKCAFWERFHDTTDIGRCRRYAPRENQVGWPETAENDWCGDFRYPSPEAYRADYPWPKP
jgi:hypothetical protein